MSTDIPIAILELAVQGGYFADIDAHMGRLCGAAEVQGIDRSAQGAIGLVPMVAAAVSRALRQGHPCLPIQTLALSTIEVPGPRTESGEATTMVLYTYPAEEVLLEALRGSAAVTVLGPESVAFSSAAADSLAAASVSTPLVLEPGASTARLYATRLFNHEAQLAGKLAGLLADSNAAKAVVDARPSNDQAREKNGADSWLNGRLDHYFSDSARDVSAVDWQREAARAAVERRFCIISGGPGTGKTSTVVKILALLVEDALRRGANVPSLGLMAPTGKAAARMTESIASAVTRLELEPAVQKAVQHKATTIHRALGVRPNSTTRFFRGAEQPLLFDIVLIDEASMVDLGLMRAVVDALKPSARLILLGDRHQLASVEAGSVLAELCAALTPQQTELGSGSSRPAAVVTELKKSYRFKEDSGIAALASQVREGSSSGALHVLSQSRADLSWHGDSGRPIESEALRRLVVDGFRPALRATTPLQALQLFEQFRILAGHRAEDFGVHALNEAVQRWLVQAALLPATGAAHYRGRLILITENDYGLDLRNGDVGVVWPDEERGSSGVQLGAYFPVSDRGDGTPSVRRVSLAQLPAFETGFAMTIHKSQGSEYDEVVVVLPPARSPLLTRELLYTGVTRAKQRAHVFGDEEAILRATERSVERHSGLGEKVLASMLTNQ